jgi:hypothetical protein
MATLDEREARLGDLRPTLSTSIAKGGEVEDDRLDEALAGRRAELREAGVRD